MEDSSARRRALEARRERALQAVKTRQIEARHEIAALVRELRVGECPSIRESVTRARRSLSSPLDEGSEEAVFAFILEKLAGYPELVRRMNRLEADFELRAAVRVYICCHIVRRYELALDPMVIAFPTSVRARLLADYAGEDPESVAAAIIGVR